jgi:hypothetical protein
MKKNRLPDSLGCATIARVSTRHGQLYRTLPMRACFGARLYDFRQHCRREQSFSSTNLASYDASSRGACQDCRDDADGLVDGASVNDTKQSMVLKTWTIAD